MRLQAFLQHSDRNKTWDCISWKALKLSSDDLKLLLEHAHAATQFWMFHGSELAVEEPEIFDQYFRLAANRKVSRSKTLGAFHIPSQVNVSRETLLIPDSRFRIPNSGVDVRMFHVKHHLISVRPQFSRGFVAMRRR